MKLLLAASLLLPAATAARAQSLPARPLPGSDAWMDSVRQLPLPRQVAAVRARVLADTILRHHPQYLCLLFLSAIQRKAYYRAQAPRTQAEAARPAGTLRLFMVDDYALTDNRPTAAAAFLQQLAARSIRRITYYPGGTPMTALYGTQGAEGVVVLLSK